MCWVQCVLQDAGIVASGRRSIGSMNERQNISKFASLVLHLAVGAHSILELRCRFHIGEREPFTRWCLNFLSVARVIAVSILGLPRLILQNSFELFLHAVSELLRRFLDVPDL